MHRPVASELNRDIALALILTVIMAVSGAPLRVGPAPAGVVSLEFATSAEAVRAILDAWRERGVIFFAGFNLGLDFLFMLAYGRALSGALRHRGQALPTVIAPHRERLAQAAWWAAGLDAVETVSLTVMVATEPSDALAILSAGCASIKFALLAVLVPAALGSLLLGRS